MFSIMGDLVDFTGKDIEFVCKWLDAVLILWELIQYLKEIQVISCGLRSLDTNILLYPVVH